MKTELLVVGMIIVAVLFGDSGKGNTVGNPMAASATKSKEEVLKFTGQMPIMTPEEVWRGFDPRMEPLEEEILREWIQDSIRFKEFYFTGHIRPAVGPEGKKGFSVYQHSSPLTYSIGDPKWRGPKGAVLHFDVATTEGEEFIVALHKRPLTPDSKEYHREVSVKGDTNWQTVTLSLDQFREKESAQALKAWRDVTALELKLRQSCAWNDGNIVFRNFRWAKQ